MARQRYDARMFSNSMLDKKLRDGSIPLCRKKILDGEAEVPICILGDPAYPLLPLLMKEFANGGKDRWEQLFGYKLSSARMVIECAFGRLKARFGCLKRDMDINLNDLPDVINACFILHNYCEMHNDQVARVGLAQIKCWRGKDSEYFCKILWLEYSSCQYYFYISVVRHFDLSLFGLRSNLFEPVQLSWD